MQRIDTTTKFTDLFGVGKHGFRDGNKASGIAATAFDAAWCNAVQEEIANFIEMAGGTLDPLNLHQMYDALIAKAGTVASTDEAQAWTENTKRITPLRLAEAFKGPNQILSANGVQKSPGGLIEQWGNGVSSGTGATNCTVTFPVSFPNSVFYVIFIPYTNTQSYQGQVSSAPTLSGASGKVGTDSTGASGIPFFWIAKGN